LNSQTRAFESSIQGLRSRVEELETERENQKGVVEAFIRHTIDAGIIPDQGVASDANLSTVMKGISDMKRQYFFTRMFYGKVIR
jgi:hypothetical protein